MHYVLVVNLHRYGGPAGSQCLVLPAAWAPWVR
jgi:hypothetical protein